MRGMQIRYRSLFAPFLLLLPVFCPTALANAEPESTDPDLRMCRPLLELPPEILDITLLPVDPDAEITLEADRADVNPTGFSQLSGDVFYRQGNRFATSESLQYNRDTGLIRSDVPIRFGNGEMIVDAATLEYLSSDGTGTLTDAQFYLPARHAHGGSDSIAILSDTQSELNAVSYSTCTPGDEDWILRASSMELDTEEGFGVGRNVRVAFMGVPFFYIPWISFPIDDRRKTGFLFPEYGSSSLSGDILRVPYYINIAPNLDATLTPHIMSKRGARLDTEFRYLFESIGTGEVDYEYLDEDRITGERRYRGRLQHRKPFESGWLAIVDYNAVSDPEYLQDFTENGGATTISFVSQSALLQKTGNDFGMSLRVQSFETVDPTISPANYPYELLPELNLFYKPLPYFGLIEFGIDGQFTDFEATDRINGYRHHVNPSLALNLGIPGVEITPRLSYWATTYQLTEADNVTERDEHRRIPVSSLDIRSVFETRLDNGFIQTLAPRLFYLNVPYEDQDAVPRFDSREPSAVLSQLYRENRFTGLDRLGDTEQLTIGFETRLLDSGSYQDLFRFEMARAWYFKDREVGLNPGDPAQTAEKSDLFAAISYTPSADLDFRLDTSWQPGSNRVQTTTLRSRYSPWNEGSVELSYSFRRDLVISTIDPRPLEQARLAFTTPVTDRWKLFGKLVYSIPEQQSYETLLGVEYESCCWAFRTFQRRYIFNRDGEFNSALWLQLELKGLSSVGRKADEFLTEEISGYGE